MTEDRAGRIAHFLLREGVLRKGDREHGQIYQDLVGNPPFFAEVKQRLAQVGYELVENLGHLGVRPGMAENTATDLRNRMGLDAGHIRLLVYLWVHLVYREWTNLRRDLQTAPPGAGQTALFKEEDDEATYIPWNNVKTEFAEVISISRFKGLLNRLQALRFIRYDEKRDRIWADSGLYVYLDLRRMEDFVVDLARRLGTEDVNAAVLRVAKGSRIPEEAE
jgi:hypothetical protein